MSGRRSTMRLQAGTLAGLLSVLAVVGGPVHAETWTADMQLNKQRSAGMCQRAGEFTYTMDWTAGKLTAKAQINSFSARTAADGAVSDAFFGELDQGLNTTVTTKMPRFTITGNAQTRQLDMAWPAGSCIWTLKPRA